MKKNQIVIFILCISLCFVSTFGQKKNDNTIVLKGTVKIAIQTAVPLSIDTTVETGKPTKPDKKFKNKENKRDLNKERETRNSLNGKIEIQIVKGAVIRFTNEKGNIFSAKTDAKGKFKIGLPIGKYTIYATANEECWMCAEYYNYDFLITDKHKSNLNIILQFFGEG